MFEGAIDSWFLPNSMASASVNVDVSFLDENQNIRYMYDNDEVGTKKMLQKLAKGKTVFMWEKFLSDMRIDYVKDMNELIQVLHKRNELHKVKSIKNYFTNNQFDCTFL